MSLYRYFPQVEGHNGRGWNFQVLRLLSQAHHGGGHFTEAHHALSRMTPGDNASWYREWRAEGAHLEAMAEEAMAADHRLTARDRFFRAFNYYRMSEFFLAPEAPEKLATYQQALTCFGRGGALNNPPFQRVRVPYGETTLPAWFFPAEGVTGKAPAVVFFGGADSIAEELYFTAPGVMKRGLHLLIVDGPGQGAALRLQGIVSRHDYEVPAAAACDYLLNRPEVQHDRIALMAMSLGGYYAGRAAAFEHRFQACVVWGPLYDLHELWETRGDDHALAPMTRYLLGAKDMPELREMTKRFTLNGLVGQIACATLVVAAEDDGHPLHLVHTERLYTELTCPKQLKIFRSGEGGSAHCQQDHLTLANELIGDWLTDTLSR